METNDFGNPAYDDDYNQCPVCGNETINKGVCSNTCFEADMM
jgi:hypothetical protein|tara:strand:+ start:103 stop:228 length:126 start_codon:yes stop_codon:yes gene_type:complete